MTEASTTDASMAGAIPQAEEVREEPAIWVEHLTHRFGARTVLDDVSFCVEPGEIFGFIGPNGAGKTTTIRVIATLLEPAAGQVRVEGFDVLLQADEVRRRIGYMADHAGVYPRLTVREYLEFFARAYQLEELGVVDAVIELTDLAPLADQLVATLSKGMRQRLQLGRVLLHDPAVLVLDEPASDLDPRARIEMRDLLLELRELGKTIFLSSHILSELSDVCSSVAILEHGRLLVSGSINEIAERLEASSAAQHPGPAQEHAQVQPGPAHSAAAHAYPGPAQPAGAMAPGPPAAAPPAAAPPAGPSPTENAASPSGHTWQAAPGTTGVPGAVGVPGTAGDPQVPGITPGGATVPASAHKRLRLRVLGEAVPVAHLLSSVQGVYEVQPSKAGQLTVGYVGGDAFIAELVRLLVSRGVGLVAVEPERNQLERIFLEATRGQV